MANHITGTLAISHSVDPNGSLSLTVPLQVPPSKLTPTISLDYHSAAKDVDVVGMGWVLKGLSRIERVPATIAQDNLRGSVNYDKNDRFSLNGQRLIKVGKHEYRYEIEQWSKIIATGDEENPDSWTEYVSDGTVRSFGTTSDSNIKAQGQSDKTRVWAISKHADAFTNSVSYNYINDTANGTFHPSDIHYGGNNKLKMDHQRHIVFAYEDRPDTRTTFHGGFKIHTSKRLKSISVFVGRSLIHTHTLTYVDDNGISLPLKSRLRSLTLSDATGAVLSPLIFDWNTSKAAVFDPLKEIATVSTGITTSGIMHLDVTASGKSDLLLYSKRQDDDIDNDGLYLAVHLADGQGGVNPVPASAGFTGLSYPDQLLSIDVNGNGRSDLLHIVTRDDGVHDITTVLSTSSGNYQPQKTSTCQLESSSGRFFTGDFKGDGNVGFIYIYVISDDDSSDRIRYVQFDSEHVDGAVEFKDLPALNGPLDVSLDALQVVVADLNGNGTEDVFLISPRDNKAGTATVCDFKLLRSDEEGVLRYLDDDPLKGIGEEILWEYSTFIPYSIDNDGKTGLLALSRNDDNYLQYRILRSTGISLHVPASPTDTEILYNGNIHLVKALSTETVDLLNTYETDDGIVLDVLHFHDDSFTAIKGVQQPTGAMLGSQVTTADIRGTGRADCVFSTTDDDGNMTIHSLTHSDAQPIDFVSGYTNGLGAKVSVEYAPLTDPRVYTAKEDRSATSAMNAMARNVSSRVSLSSSGGVASLPGRRGRSQLVHYPTYVVKQLCSCASPSLYPNVLDQSDFTYKNARMDHGGRGWQGFETIVKAVKSVGLVESTSYVQHFPFIGQTSKVERTELSSGKPVQVNTFDWDTVAASSENTIHPIMRNLRESHYEGGTSTYDVDVSLAHDTFGNVKKLAIAAPRLEKPTLIIETSYENDTDRWVFGKKTEEVVRPGDGSVRQTRMKYIPGTRVVSDTSTWVADSTWSTQAVEFDEAGNETTIHGPGQSLRTVEYDDETRSFPASISLFTDTNASLTEVMTYDLATGLPLSVTDPNGHITAHKYDVLGRLTEISEGDHSARLSVMEKRSYSFDNRSPCIYTRQTRTDFEADNWVHSVSRLDGLSRVTRNETNRPDDASAAIYSDMEYDGAGRVIKHSRNYASGQTPKFTTNRFDARSRPLTTTSPAAIAGVPLITTTYKYEFDGKRSVVTETKSGGGRQEIQVTLREYEYFPNPEPKANHYVRPLVVNSVNELKQSVETSFDGLGRPILAKDPTGVSLTLRWDGLSRQVERKIANPAGTLPALISHFSMEYNDDLSQSSVRNVLADTLTTTKSDFIQRMISKIASDEELTYTYDTGGNNVKHRLASVTSSKGSKHRFDYDARGNISTFTLSIDGQDYTTSYNWTASKQLQSTKNPNGSVVKRTFFSTSDAVQKVELADANDTVQASVNFSHFNDTVLRPLVSDFKNGLTSKVAIAENGVPTQFALYKGDNVIHNQEWQLDGFSRIESHLAGTDSLLRSSVYNYDKAGRLVQSSQSRGTSESSGLIASPPEIFEYDDSGNIASKNKQSFVNNGWQLSHITSEDKTPHSSFQYSPDGNLTAKMDGSGQQKKMKYDAEGRLSDVDGTAFVYDFNGHLIKVIRSNGDTTIYPNPSYEVHISGGKIFEAAYISAGSGRHASYTLTREESVDKIQGSQSAVHYYHTDHLGSTVAVSNDKGEIITEYEYDSFGKATLISGDDVARYKYSGKEIFEGLYYFGVRFYDSEIGRFLTLDDYPIDLSRISPSTFNQYIFSRNDPINFFDFNGNVYVPWWHWVLDTILAVGAVVFMFASGGAASVVSSMMLGAAVNGFANDLSSEFVTHKNDDGQYLIQVGIGIVTGAVTGGTGVVLSGVKALSVVTADGALVATNTFKAASGVALKISAKIGIRTIVGTGTGVGSQALTNLAQGKPIDTDLGEAAAKAAFASFLSAGAAEAKGFAIAKALKGAQSNTGAQTPLMSNASVNQSYQSFAPRAPSSPMTIPARGLTRGASLSVPGGSSGSSIAVVPRWSY